MPLSDFIPPEGQRRIATAITQAERHTTGEICVHVTPRCRGKVMKRAEHIFNRLQLYRTRYRNAVLIFIAYHDRRLAVLGDEALDRQLPPRFWDDVVAKLSSRLAAGQVVDGVCEAVATVGERLAEYFPAERDDVNELSNEVSFSDEDE